MSNQPTFSKPHRDIALIGASLASLAEAQPATAKAEETEVKFVVREKDVDNVKKVLNLGDAAEHESICFYEATNRDLDAQKIILRSRYLTKDKHGNATADDDKHNGTTVKLRTNDKIDREKEKEWVSAIEADPKVGKIEKDQVVGKNAVESLSLDNPQKGTEISKVEDKREVKKIFSALQERFVAAHLSLDWGSLQRIGPIKARAWKKVAIEGFGEEFDAEEWILKRDGQAERRLLEISAKVAGDKAAADAFGKKLNEFMEARQFTQDPDAETKTKTVFNYFLGE